MAFLDVRRHAQRVDLSSEESELSNRGRSMCLRLAQSAPRYGLVVASPLTRASQTAEMIAGKPARREDALRPAMSAAINDRYDALISLGLWSDLLAELAEARAIAEAQLALWSRFAAEVPPGGSGLVVTHGGLVELPAALLAERLGFPLSGPRFGYGEGMHVSYADGVPTSMTVLRAS